MRKALQEANTLTRAATRQMRRPALVVAVLAAITVVCAFTGPFNTFLRGTFFDRLYYWGGAIGSSWLVAEFAKLVAERARPEPIFWREVVANLTFVPIYAPILILWTGYAFPVPLEDQLSAWEITAYVAVIAAAISVLRYGLPHLFPQHAQETPAASAQEVRPRLHQRLPCAACGKILRLSGDGHYVKVTTDTGCFDVRMRLCDAVAEMDGVPGHITHRSHWVSADAITGQTERRGRPILVLSNGEEVPVGAKFQPELEAAGILKPRGIGTANA